MARFVGLALFLGRGDSFSLCGKVREAPQVPFPRAQGEVSYSKCGRAFGSQRRLLSPFLEKEVRLGTSGLGDKMPKDEFSPGLGARP